MGFKDKVTAFIAVVIINSFYEFVQATLLLSYIWGGGCTVRILYGTSAVVIHCQEFSWLT